MAGGAPGGGAAGDGVAGEIGFTLGAGAAFFPAMLEQPGFGRDVGDVGAGSEAVDRGGFVFFGDVFQGAEGDEANFFSKRSGIELASGNGGVEAEAPADLVGHPVADTGAGVLVEEKGFQGLFGVAFDEFTNAGEGEFRILRLGRELGPGIGAVVEHDPAKHAVVVENEGGLVGPDDEVIVFVFLVISRGGGEFSGHAEMDFKMKLGSEGKEHAFAVSF